MNEHKQIPEERAEAIRAAFAGARGRDPDEPTVIEEADLKEIRMVAPDASLPDPADALTFSPPEGNR